MPAPWDYQVQHIRDGEPVDQHVASRPDRQLERRDQYLKDRLDAAGLGEAVVAYGSACAPGVTVGMPVAWNAANGRFEPAIAATRVAPGGALELDPLADVVGVVRAKASATSADVVLAGRATIDLTGVVTGVVTAGRYYLSAATPGKLVRQRPPVSVSVLFADGAGTVYVQPTSRELLEAHVHHKFDLVCAPAGVHSDPGVGNRHQVLSPDPTKSGWLPANHASFGGKAPAGAVFGYNLAAHPSLQSVFPPIPPEAAVLVWDKGLNRVGGVIVPTGSDALAVVNRDGIWWFSDVYGDVPWPANYNSASPPADVGPNSGSPESPRAEEMRLTLAFAQMLLATDKTVVTRLSAPANSPITLDGCAVGSGYVGDVRIDLDLDLLVSDQQEAGSLVLKSLQGATFRRGHVVEKLVAGAGVTLTPTVGNPAAAQGAVTIDVDVDPGDRELLPEIVRLDDARERFHLDVPFIGFPAGRKSAVQLRFRVPYDGLPSQPVARLRLWLYGSFAGTLPALSATRRRLVRPSGAPVPTPTADTVITLNTGVAVASAAYVEVQSEPFAVAEGDTILVTLARAVSDGYAGEVGLFRNGLVLASS